MKYIEYLENGTVINVSDSEILNSENNVSLVDYDFFPGQPPYLLNWNGEKIVKNDDRNIQDYLGRGYKIYDLVNEETKEKNLHDIDYVKELKSNVRLKRVQTFNEGAHLKETLLYYNYVDKDNPGELIVVIEENYVLDDSTPELYPTARRTMYRTKVRKWVKFDGSIDEENVKVSPPKLYDTLNKSNKEGVRRRETILNIMSENVVTALLLSGVFSSQIDAEDALISLIELYSQGVASYVKTGRGALISDIENDSENNWLNSVVVDTPQTNFICGWMVGMSIKSYIVLKLKGNIK